MQRLSVGLDHSGRNQRWRALGAAAGDVPRPRRSFREHGGVAEDGTLSLPMMTFVVRAAGRLVLVDTGIGPRNCTARANRVHGRRRPPAGRVERRGD